MRSWSDARNEGIREGLMMALAAIRTDLDPEFESVVTYEAIDPIIARGNRHFGDSEWQAKPRPGTP